VRYLRRVQGRPRNGPRPGNCGRVSCSYKSAIWWCNDVSNYLTNNLVLETYDFLYRTRAHIHLVVLMILLMVLHSFWTSVCGICGLLHSMGKLSQARHFTRTIGMSLLDMITIIAKAYRAFMPDTLSVE
jgi:hypothetical protein